MNRKDCAGVYLYVSEKAIQLGLDCIQCLGKPLVANGLFSICVLMCGSKFSNFPITRSKMN